MLPFVPAAAEPGDGVVRLASRDQRAGEVRLTAIDDAGRRYGPVTLPLSPGQTIELLSRDLEQGNPLKGLQHGFGTGEGDWRIAATSRLVLDVLGYAESADGLRTPLREVVGLQDGEHRIALFPAGGTVGEGWLRLVNPAPAAVEVTIRGYDDSGGGGTVHLALPGESARWLSASSLESGTGVAGGLGDATGDRRLAIAPSAPITVMALSRGPAGTLGNLSASYRRLVSTADADDPASAATAQVVWWLPEATSGSEGLVRLVNRTERQATARITRHGAAGIQEDAVGLSLRPGASATLTRDDLELGNTASLRRGLGATRRPFWLEVHGDVAVLDYVRRPDGTLSSIRHATGGLGAPNRVSLAAFPAGAAATTGHLTLTNPSWTPVPVRITGVDEDGLPGGLVRVDLPPRATRVLSSDELSWGADGLDGSLGSGRGMWRLSIWSGGPLAVTAHQRAPSGGIETLGTVGPASPLRASPAPVGDLNGDGKSDVILRHLDGRWYYYPLDERANIAAERGTVALHRDTRWQLAGIGDIDGDGKDDVILRHVDGSWFGALMDGRTVRASGALALPSGTSWTLAGVGDLDGDGTADALLRHATGSWRYAPLNGLGLAPSGLASVALPRAPAWRFAAMGDFNGDGMDDVLLRNADGRWRYYPMDGGRVMGATGAAQITANPDWRLAGIGDLNGDGKDDVVLRHVDGRWYYYPMDGGRNIAPERGSMRLTPNLDWSVVGLGDLNGDGTDGILLRHVDGRWVHYPMAGRQVAAAGPGRVAMTRNPDWTVAGPEPAPDGDEETAAAVFAAAVSAPIVHGKCIACHVAGGPSGHTRLVFVPETEEGHVEANRQAFEDYVRTVPSGADLVLSKVQGAAGHGGGIQLIAGTAEFADLERFLRLTGAELDDRTPIAPALLFEGVAMEPARRTLRRAAILFAGRNATAAEQASIRPGGFDRLRAAVRGLMAGPAFHDFLIRSANDRLLTDRDWLVVDPNDGHLIEHSNRYFELMQVSDPDAWSVWAFGAQYGFRRAPLELIAHVAMSELPYTEVLTADYVMANPMAADGYGANTAFDDPTDAHDFRPSEIGAYYVQAAGYEVTCEQGNCIHSAPPGLWRPFPHAGVLNTKVFLQRYPTTPTNRNRARARWTYYHFLGLDVEKSASRTTDPVALADRANPTMYNPACTVCHGVLDPVAGAFEDYGDVGFYKDQYGGEDSLDEFYKYSPNGRADYAVRARSRDDGLVRLGTVRLIAGRESELGIRNATGTAGRIALGDVVLRSRDGAEVARFRARDAAPEDACGEPLGDDGYALDACDELLALDLAVAADGDYTVDIEAWLPDADAPPATLAIWMPGPFWRRGDTWYRDMRPPGLAGRLAPAGADRLQWLARAIAADDRFAEAAVKFWWPAVMGHDVAEPPAEGDANFAARLSVSNAQTAETRRLANGFKKGFRGRSAYDLKDLLTELVISKWFRAATVKDTDPVRSLALETAGARRLLTPEELAAKTLALTGFEWGRWVSRAGQYPADDESGALSRGREYGLLYGGIDSDGVTQRAREITSVMAGVAQSHAIESSCPIAMREFYLLDDHERALFAGIDPTESPATAAAARLIRSKLVELYELLLGVEASPQSAEIENAYDLFMDVQSRKAGDDFRVDGIACEWATDQRFLDGIVPEAFGAVGPDGNPSWRWDRVNAHFETVDWSDPHGVARTWTVVLAYLLMDYRYLHL